MPILSTPELQFTKYVGDAPAAGIVYALMPDNSAKAVLGYDPATNTALLPAKVSGGFSADAAVQAITASNASAGANAQAIVAAVTSLVTGYLVALNATTNMGVHLVAQTNHALYFSTNATLRAKILATGEMVVGASDVGGSELFRVLLGIRAGGKVLSGAATSISEVAVNPVGSRQTFYGDGSGWQMRWARQAAYGASSADVLILSDTGILGPAADTAGQLGASNLRWGLVWASALKLGAPVVAAGRTDAVQLVGSFYMEGLLGVVANSINAFVVANPSGSAQHFRVDTSATAATYVMTRLFVSPTQSTTVAIFSAEPALSRVTVGLGYATASVSLVVNGLVSAAQQYLLDGLVFADRLVTGWTRFKAQDGRDAFSFSTNAMGGNFYVLADLFTVVSSSIAGTPTQLTIDTLSNPTQLSVAVNHNGTLKRILVGGTDSGGSGRRLLTIVN